MSAFDNIAARLDGLKRTGPTTVIARCPAHEDRHPSLSVKEAGDGRVLLKCWAGCDVHSIVGALGLDICDLFPPRPDRPGGGLAPVRRPWTASDLLELATFEATVAMVTAADVARGRTLDAAEIERAAVAAGRLADMVEAVHAR